MHGVDAGMDRADVTSRGFEGAVLSDVTSTSSRTHWGSRVCHTVRLPIFPICCAPGKCSRCRPPLSPASYRSAYVVNVVPGQAGAWHLLRGVCPSSAFDAVLMPRRRSPPEISIRVHARRPIARLAERGDRRGSVLSRPRTRRDGADGYGRRSSRLRTSAGEPAHGPRSSTRYPVDDVNAFRRTKNGDPDDYVPSALAASIARSPLPTTRPMVASSFRRADPACLLGIRPARVAAPGRAVRLRSGSRRSS